MSDFIIKEFYEEMQHVSFDVYGILDANDMLHTLGTDSKIIGRVFEMITEPVLARIAERHNLKLKTPKSQTVYPDFILMKNDESKDKIAIDVKSTYVVNDTSKIQFTLGSFGSYMRNNTKNIEYEYTDYAKHYVIGFVYKRNGKAQESRVYNLSERKNITPPYQDVRFFIQEKYKIAGDKTGSGNTENIGSILSNNFLDFKEGRGPFSTLGEDVFDVYWKYYPKYRATEKPYINLNEFISWISKQNINEINLLHPYNRQDLLEKINNYKDMM